ncbi:unnamed protein product, partial [marine sediment metagenome]
MPTTFTLPPALGTPVALSTYYRNGIIPMALAMSNGVPAQEAFNFVKNSPMATNPLGETFRTALIWGGYNLVRKWVKPKG